MAKTKKPSRLETYLQTYFEKDATSQEAARTNLERIVARAGALHELSKKAGVPDAIVAAVLVADKMT